MQEEIFPDKEHFGHVFYNNARLSAEGVFQMAAIMGSCVAGGAYLPIMSDESHIVEGRPADLMRCASYRNLVEWDSRGGNSEMNAIIVQDPHIEIREQRLEELPRSQPGLRRLDLTALRQPQEPGSGIGAVIGKWPGTETDDEIFAVLDELS